MLDKGIGTQGYYETYYASRDWRFYKDILSLIIAYSEPGPILDIGAGCGFVVEGAVRWGLSCEGIEGSSEAVHIAKKRLPEMKIRQHFLSRPFQFESESFQTVLMNQVIEHLEPKVAENCVKESNRVLRDGGVLIITSPSKYNKYEKKSDSTHINLYSPSELRNLLAMTGFSKTVSFDSVLPVLGRNKISLNIVKLLYRISRLERLCATANLIAFKSHAK